MRFRISPSTSSSNFLFPPSSPSPLSLSHRRSPPPRGDSLPKLTCCSTLSNGQNRPVSRVLLTIPPRFSARPSAFLRTSWPRRIADCAYLLRSTWKHRGKSALRSRKRYGGSSRMLDDRYLGYHRLYPKWRCLTTRRPLCQMDGQRVCVCIVNIGIPSEIRSGRGIIDAVARKGNRI